MRLKRQKRSAQPEGHLRLKLAGRISESQVSEAQRTEIC